MVDGCPCAGLAADSGPCNNKLCTFPASRTCCVPYIKSLNGNTNAFFCGPASTPANPTYNCKTTTTTTTTTVAPTTTTTVAVPACCPSGGIWGEWSTTGTCASSCGSCSNATRTRTCKSLSSGCPCTGAASDSGPCSITMCPFPATNTCCPPYVKSLNYNTNEFFCGVGNVPVDPVNNCATTTTTTTTAAPTTTTTVAVPACCPSGGIWGEWSTTGTCASSCGSCSNATRTRTCKSLTSGCPCTGAASDSGPCSITMCPFPATNTCCPPYVKSLNYNTNEFFCGVGNVPVDPVNNCETTTTTTTTAAPTTTTTAAVPSCCPSGGIWGEWSTTGTCASSCGSCSNATRTRTCKSLSSGCPCTGLAADSGPCSITMCPFPATNTCCPPYVKSLNYNTNDFFCGVGNVPVDPVNNCATTTTTTTTPAPTTTTTIANCCPTGGLWTEWVTQGTCPTTCGSCSTLTRTRTCASQADGCACTGSASETGPCGIALCPWPTNTCCGSYVKSLNYKTNEFYCGMGDDAVPPTVTCCPANSATYWSAWSEWGQTCLTTGGQERKRVCAGADKGCNCSGDTTESQACCCPTGGVWSEWQPTSGTCPTSCGSCSSVARTRTCASSKYGCACSGASTDTGPCARTPCPSGTACCTGYSAMTNPNNGGTYCEATAVPLSACCTSANMGTWGAWSAWSGACNVAPCGLCDTQTRSHTCTPGPIGCPCDGAASQSQACGSNKLCTFPTKTCCAPYIKSLINNTLVCA